MCPRLSISLSVRRYVPPSVHSSVPPSVPPSVRFSVGWSVRNPLFLDSKIKRVFIMKIIGVSLLNMLSVLVAHDMLNVLTIYPRTHHWPAGPCFFSCAFSFSLMFLRSFLFQFPNSLRLTKPPMRWYEWSRDYDYLS